MTALLAQYAIPCEKVSFHGKLDALAGGLGIQTSGRLLGDVLDDIAAKMGVERDNRLYGAFIRKLYEGVTSGEDTTLSGNPLTLTECIGGKPFGALRVYGKSTQNGVPLPTAPVPIVSAGDGGTVVVTVSDGANNSQTLTLQTPNALCGIPVASSGNYTDENGEQWVCDEVDLARGVRVQRIRKIKVTSSLNWQTAGREVDRYFAWFNGTCTSNVLCTHFSTALGSETVGGAIANRNNLVGFAFAEKGTTTLDDFKQFLDENDVFIWAALATPVETDISADEVAAYKALTTYAPTTVISASGVSGLAATYRHRKAAE
ncbi:MAG: hypothetical protein EGP83_07090 [Clostridiales bacterium]|nr:hypothetical protein [Clostridiales bacterium]